MRFTAPTVALIAAIGAASLIPAVHAQQPPAAPPAAAPGAAPQGRGNQPPPVNSQEVLADRKITFRIYAPNAQAVRLSAGDVPNAAQSAQMTKTEAGTWETTVGPVEPGAYRYNFVVDGVTVIDPVSPFVSESNTRVWSMVTVPGAENLDTRNVPRGAVSAITYYSTALKGYRRMHVYTPPGYETSTAKYPVFYLLHGAGDSDDSWTSVGRAGFILDNLIADKKAKPMVMVMPAGHTFRGQAAGRNATQEFVSDFTSDVAPYVAKNYRILTDRANTAIAGLSMGGNQTLQVAIPQLEKFAYIGVYSSGLLGAFPGMTGPAGRGAAPAAAPGAAPAAAAAPPAAAPAAPATPAVRPPSAEEWAQQHAAKLDDPNLKKGLRLFWFATGKDDGLITTTKATVELFEKRGFKPIFKETPGGHTWLNWRAYLTEFAPMLFQSGEAGRSTEQGR
ncbi:MAG: alpha/beta hydrolase-fold protein [Vicinamibacterales bacterium]